MIEEKKSIAMGFERTKEIRNLKKDGWISSVEISRMERFSKIDKRKMWKLCEGSKEFDCLKIDANGSIKYWYKRDKLDEMLKCLGDKK